MKRYVFDTNVLVSALLRNSSLPGQVFERCLAEGTILVSGALIEELQDVLSRKKFQRYVTPDERDRFLEALVLESELVELAEKIHACRDPRDDHLLQLAVCGSASCLVTGDADLLALNPFRGVPIQTPQQVWESLEQTDVNP